MDGFSLNQKTLVETSVKIPKELDVYVQPGTMVKPMKLKGRRRNVAVTFHVFPVDQITQVNKNHREDNLLFRRLIEPIKYSSRSTSNMNPMNSVAYSRLAPPNFQRSQEDISQFLTKSKPMIVELLESIIKGYSNYELGEQLKLIKTEKKILTKRSETLLVEIPPLNLMSPSQFLELVTSSKGISHQIQEEIALTGKEITPLLEALILPNLGLLLKHKLGIYPITKIIEKSQKIKDQVEKWALDNFKTLVVNEFGSKLLQKLSSLSVEFMAASLHILFKNWSSLSENISTVFYIGYVMKIAADKKEFTKVKECIKLQIDQSFSLRYNKRILVSFTRYCCEEDLSYVFDLLERNYLLQEVLNDVYFALCISILLTRGHKPTMIWVLEQSSSAKLYKLLKIKHFRSLCETIMIDMPGDFKKKFLFSFKKFLFESIADNLTLSELPPFLCFALWLTLKNLSNHHILEDSRFCQLVVHLFKREFSRGKLELLPRALLDKAPRYSSM